ncbi:MAG TPA: endonuclease/exonuclease/phosphatase family protein [Vicinamibacteria bacterium]|jgi:endonuclease/exonuclease/phosphatase family metal-dependent hydrolase
MGPQLRVVTYNVHRCRGLDGRTRPSRIVEVLREVDADIIALQEVVSREDGVPEKNQARYIAETLALNYLLGENRKLRGAAYGNVVLSRFPMRVVKNYDLSVEGYERRGCLHIDVDVQGAVVHVFNVHLGTDFLERRHQGRRLADAEILRQAGLTGPRLLLGDFNEWTPGLTTRLLGSHLKSVDIRKHLRRRRTYPGVLPFMHLDHIYHDDTLELQALQLHRTRRALVASDHLPLIAEFKLVRKHIHEAHPLAPTPVE